MRLSTLVSTLGQLFNHGNLIIMWLLLRLDRLIFNGLLWF